MNPSKAKGTAFESAVVAYLKEGGFPEARRIALAGKEDGGDIYPGVPGWILEAKNTRQIALAAAVDEATWEAANAKVSYGAAVIKRRNRGVADAYVVVPLRLWCSFLRQVGDGGLSGGVEPSVSGPPIQHQRSDERPPH